MPQNDRIGKKTIGAKFKLQDHQVDNSDQFPNRGQKKGNALIGVPGGFKAHKGEQSSGAKLNIDHRKTKIKCRGIAVRESDAQGGVLRPGKKIELCDCEV